ncbi:uncharacterized protein At1g51745-like [Diospyros lotus]|uniref:uncharacterized protein At1g51745-like n=1 Tax=Diospyros lotus TaxID=55363 RepID=UPI00224D0A9A|nr:uncharacterized protein At1g51745-like [Diospyros lotus]
MGLPKADCRAGKLVWVQRKNGSWWPGRVVEPNELSPFPLVPSKPGTPVKLLGREDSRVDWYNLEKSKRIKAFRCREFDDCIERAESSHSQANVLRRIAKYARREDAILHALELEKLELQKRYKAPEEKQARTICQAKRSRRIYLPAESSNCWKCMAFPPEQLNVSSSRLKTHKCRQQSGSAEYSTSSKPMESDWSARDSEGPNKVQAETWHPADLQVRKWELERNGNSCDLTKMQGNVIDGKSCVELKDELQANGRPLSSSAVLHGQSRTDSDTKLRGNSKWSDNPRPESAPSSSYFLDSDSQSINPECIGFHNQLETLTNVELMVQASNQQEHVPLVSITSRLNGKAIVGHPIDIEASEDCSSEILIARKRKADGVLFDNFGNKMFQPVWRTSERTPVHYGPLCFPSPSQKDDESALTCRKPSHSNHEARADNMLPPQQSPGRPMKMYILSKQKTRAISSFDTEQKHGGNQADVPHFNLDSIIRKASPSTGVACVPVKLIFSDLLVALCRAQS